MLEKYFKVYVLDMLLNFGFYLLVFFDDVIDLYIFYGKGLGVKFLFVI